MNKTIRWGVSACAAALALALAGGVASAQQKAPDAPAKADAKKAAPAAKKADAKKAPSACAGIEEPACLANTECMWVKEVVRKNGVKQKAHCQKKPPAPAAKKAAEPKKDTPAKAAAPAPKAAAPAPKAADPAAKKQ